MGQLQTTECCSQPVLCQVGSISKQKMYKRSDILKERFCLFRDPIFDLKHQNIWSMWHLCHIFLASSSNRLSWAIIPGNETQLGSIPLGNCQEAVSSCPGDASSWRLCVLQLANAPEGEVERNRCMNKLFVGERKVCSMSKSRNIALILKTRLHVSWSSSHELWAWEDIKVYEQQLIFYRAILP